MSRHKQALRRFWPIVAVGVVLGVLAVLAAMFKLPTFEQRSPANYTATAKLLITSAHGPYMRTTVTTTDGTPATGSTAATTTTRTSAPNLAPFVQAANLYPLLVESDQVQRYREKQFGVIKGDITANAIYQVATPSRFHPSDLPVIQVFGTTTSGPTALQLTQQTSQAFISWIAGQQQASGIPKGQRIVVQEISSPEAIDLVKTGGTPMSLAALVFLAVVAVFALIAIVLDRIRPVSQSAMAPTAVPEPDVSSARPAPVPEPVTREATPVAPRVTLKLEPDAPREQRRKARRVGG